MRSKEFKVLKKYCGDEEIVLISRQATTHEADIALELIRHWGMVCAVPDGEDSAGRARVRRMTPAEITEHACDTAAALWAEFEKRGWRFEVPVPRTEEELKAAEKAEKELLPA